MTPTPLTATAPRPLVQARLSRDLEAQNSPVEMDLPPAYGAVGSSSRLPAAPSDTSTRPVKPLTLPFGDSLESTPLLGAASGPAPEPNVLGLPPNIGMPLLASASMSAGLTLANYSLFYGAQAVATHLGSEKTCNADTSFMMLGLLSSLGGIVGSAQAGPYRRDFPAILAGVEAATVNTFLIHMGINFFEYFTHEDMWSKDKAFDGCSVPLVFSQLPPVGMSIGISVAAVIGSAAWLVSRFVPPAQVEEI